MKYMGSKNRIAKHILPIMLNAASCKNIKNWVEPFVGGGNMIDKVPKEFKRLGIDINEHTINAMLAVRDMAKDLPDSLTEFDYRLLKGKIANPVDSWLRFVASFGGKLDNGYAREKGSNEFTFIGYGKRNAIKQQPNLQGVKFEVGNFLDYDFDNTVIYCDPPYEGVTGYKNDRFNHNLFWDWCRKMSKKNVVFISEYNAPFDFKEVWRGEVKTNFASQRDIATHNAIEKLFTI